MSRQKRPQRALTGDVKDSGAALVLVVGSMLVLVSLALVALTYSLNSQKFARYDQDYSAAMSAAQSGVDDFISRLNRDDGYGLTVDCDNDAWQGPNAPGNSCGWNASTPSGWLPVEPGETDPEAAWFHYEVDATSKLTQGTVGLTVTGRVNDVYRTIQTAVGKGGSTDFVYYTDYESADPANVQAYPPSTVSGWTSARKNACGLNGYNDAQYWYEGRSGRSCVEITFIGGDVLDGDVFTNDSIYGTSRSGVKPSFLKQVYTADERCLSAGSSTSSWESNCLRSGSVANFNGVKPLHANPEYLDDTSAAFASYPGCHYFGSTRVIFRNDGMMTVWNPTSINGGKEPEAIQGPDGTTPNCGTLDQLDNTSGATIPVPDGMVIYVGTAPGTMRQCYGGEIGGPSSSKRLPLGDYTGQAAGSGRTYTIDTNMLEDTKACARGNLYAEGVLKGRVTIASAESVIVTGDLVLAGGLNGPDMLGLVATNSVEVFHPRLATVSSTRTCSSWGTSCGPWTWGSPGSESEVSGWPTRYNDPTTGSRVPTTGVQIAGSIQTLQHSFLVQKYAVGGAQGTLLVNGSIAQRWRGIVGQGDNGYTKLYQYDTRLKYSSPPYFPRWASSQWTLRYSGEINTPSSVRG